jgi:uncharacterized protein
MLSLPGYAGLFAIGAIASAINTVAGGGSLISFPALTVGYGLPSLIANATNSVALWPGSMSGAIGYWNLISKAGRYFKALLLPTLLGSIVGALLLVKGGQGAFTRVVPFLIFFAALLLVLQPKIKKWATRKGHQVSLPAGLFAQFLVAIYGGYFGAGMGIMMLGTFALTMEGDIHELNAVKNWLGLFINLVCSIYFVVQGLVRFEMALPLTLGSLVGGYASARFSQKIEADKLRIAIAIYGIGMAAWFLFRTLG